MMYSKYLITGATGFLGRAVIDKLAQRGANITALVLPEDPYKDMLPQEVDTVTGDVCNMDSLKEFFTNADENTCVIHCAGIVSVASHPGQKLYQVNVWGTWNVVRQCTEHRVGKLVYVSSVHAIPEKPKGTAITEECVFSPGLVEDDYSKSKALATEIVFEAAQNGLNASVVFPSGIIGPGDVQNGSFTSMVKSFIAGRLPFAVYGGYDFVDVRDVADGIIGCAEHAEQGRGYILSGHYITIWNMLSIVGKAVRKCYRPLCFPVRIAKFIAVYYEKYSLKRNQKLFFTPYSIAVLASNGQFSHAAATNRFSYKPRPIETTLRDMALWLHGQRRKS